MLCWILFYSLDWMSTLSTWLLVSIPSILLWLVNDDNEYYMCSCRGGNESAIACDAGLYNFYARATNESACQVLIFLYTRIVSNFSILFRNVKMGTSAILAQQHVFLVQLVKGVRVTL